MLWFCKTSDWAHIAHSTSFNEIWALYRSLNTQTSGDPAHIYPEFPALLEADGKCKSRLTRVHKKRRIHRLSEHMSFFTRQQVVSRLWATRDRQMHVHRSPRPPLIGSPAAFYAPFTCPCCLSTALSVPLGHKVSLPEQHTDPDLILPETGAPLFYTLPTMRAPALQATVDAIPGLLGIRHLDTGSQIKWDIQEKHWL